MSDRFLGALGALAAGVALLAGFALLLAVLADGHDSSPPPAVVLRIAESGPRHVAAPSRRPASPAPQRVHRTMAATASRSAPGVVPPPTLLGRPRRGPAFEIAHVRAGARVALAAEPGGPVATTVGPRTEFGSPVFLSVVATRPGWLGVSSPALPDGELGWIRRDPSRVDVSWTRYSLRASLSRRTLELRYGDAVVGRFPVTVGGPGTETPTGRYGVTDGINFHDSPYYGCCALALSGRQEQPLPAGWIGGDRLAIHGTPGAVGLAESLGCIRATDETMRLLFARVPLGTPVFVQL